jgi:alkylmercury lyase
MVNLEDLSRRLLQVLPGIDPLLRASCTRLYQLLAQGQPVSVEQFAQTLGISPAAASAMLENREIAANLILNEQGRITGFGGLSVTRMPHTLLIRGKKLYTWCAWDAFFIPAILGEAADVQSPCPQTGELIKLRIAPERITRSSHDGAVMSFVLPERRCCAVRQGLEDFCEHIFLFASIEAGTTWQENRAGSFLLTLDEAFRLARLKNAAQYNLPQ